MIVFDQIHTVTLEVAGATHVVGRANLRGHIDTLADLRTRVVANAHLCKAADRTALGDAFDRAHAACEALHGDAVEAGVDGVGFRLTVRRSLDG